jgi:hypothetical protein
MCFAFCLFVSNETLMIEKCLQSTPFKSAKKARQLSYDVNYFIIIISAFQVMKLNLNPNLKKRRHVKSFSRARILMGNEFIDSNEISLCNEDYGIVCAFDRVEILVLNEIFVFDWIKNC